MRLVGPEHSSAEAELEECGEKLVNLRNYSNAIIIAIEKVSGRMQSLPPDTCFVRRSVAMKLARAQSHLKKGMRLKIIDGFRPISAQKKIYRQYFKVIANEHKDWTKKEVTAELDQWVANPYTQIPAHSTGGTVDLTIADANGNELDMGTEVNVADPQRSITLSRKIGSRAAANRKLLINAMSGEGFTNYSKEWWHWSYGDWRWAIAERKVSIYGIYRGRRVR